MKSKTTLLFSLLLVLCLSVAPSAKAASAEDEALQVVKSFIKAMSTSDMNLMSSLWLKSPKTTAYQPDSLFLYKGAESIENLWKSSLELPAGTNAATIHDSQCTMIDDNVAVTTTYANHVYTDPKTKEQSVSQIRQTLVLQKVNGKWLIVHHHASTIPAK
jgi:uncharacterized protein (TIGR02246 family)